MAEDLQIRQLLKAWLDYIHIEHLSNAKVEADDSEHPNIWDSQVNLVGDKLLIDESLFKNIKQQFRNSKNQGQTELPRYKLQEKRLKVPKPFCSLLIPQIGRNHLVLMV
ncbi:hypothetical protein NUACC21_69130 [Scytonema sp. NUACC21]